MRLWGATWGLHPSHLLLSLAPTVAGLGSPGGAGRQDTRSPLTRSLQMTPTWHSLSSVELVRQNAPLLVAWLVGEGCATSCVLGGKKRGRLAPCPAAPEGQSGWRRTEGGRSTGRGAPAWACASEGYPFSQAPSQEVQVALLPLPSAHTCTPGPHVPGSEHVVSRILPTHLLRVSPSAACRQDFLCAGSGTQGLAHAACGRPALQH